MRKLIVQILIVVIGVSVGEAFLPHLWSFLRQPALENSDFINSVIGAIIFLFLSFVVDKPILRGLAKLDEYISHLNLQKLALNSIGSLLGLIAGTIASVGFWALDLPYVSSIGPLALMIGFAYVGFRIFSSRGSEISSMFSKKKNFQVDDKAGDQVKVNSPYHDSKLLDTSSIIDGRIIDVLKTGFISGTILIPNFVIFELQLIADSNDKLKRAKGRRGLDLVNAIRGLKNIHVETSDKDYEDIHEVDTKLLKLASEIKASLITNDYNLNKVAEIQGIQVLNINELANAVKPQVVTGEELDVIIIKKGTERHQGIGYMPDGTMIVVEDTDDKIDDMVRAEVTSSIQTNAGRMIFAKLVEA
ncbi:PIN/TRAM domain-containing protein [Streptococcaceae bacterium ESL0729]|nr:PIN/TRAM domain-containing protein [Streptococcaceae bacterium ESL0729]